MKLELLHRHVEKAEAQLPTDGRMAAEGFNKLTAEVDALKRWSGQVFTNNMGQELESMQQRGLAHEQSINSMRQAIEASSAAAMHFQTITDGLGVAMSVQEGRVGGLEHHTAQLTSSVEAMRVPGEPILQPTSGSSLLRRRISSRRRAIQRGLPAL